VPYDEDLEARVQAITARWRNTRRMSMFGGVCHLINGNMFVGVYQEFLIVRLGEKGAGKALALPEVKPFDITGRPMKGWVMIAPAGTKDDGDLRAWLERARTFTRSLPPKT
jgi:hypothetical protein